MRTASAQLIAYLNALRAQSDAQMLMADCFTLTLANGTVLRYTNFDVTINVDGAIFLANSILIDGLKFKCAAGTDVDQQKLTLSAKPTDLILGVPWLAAIANGVLDGAEIQRDRVFLTSLGANDKFTLDDVFAPADIFVNTVIGGVTLFKGRVGPIDNVGRTTAEITVNSDLVLLDLMMPRNLYAPSCNWVLYSPQCGVSRAAHQTTGSVGAGASLAAIAWSGAASVYTQGTILFTSGANAGVSANIKSAGDGVLNLSYPLDEAPEAGDTFIVSQGCDHTQATCENQFGNLANFRGFPYVPPPTYAA